MDESKSLLEMLKEYWASLPPGRLVPEYNLPGLREMSESIPSLPKDWQPTKPNWWPQRPFPHLSKEELENPYLNHQELEELRRFYSIPNPSYDSPLRPTTFPNVDKGPGMTGVRG